MASNLPPGVSDYMIPGNRPEDEEFDKIWDMMEYDVSHYGFSPRELEELWKRALESFGKMHNTISMKNSLKVTKM